tara:strand:+ start:621 stop:776 length:156 start_codon:yes stop_codon:yes gene_type:complete
MYMFVVVERKDCWDEMKKIEASGAYKFENVQRGLRVLKKECECRTTRMSVI